MNLEHKGGLDNSCINLTDFTCADGRKNLKGKKLYKIIWAKDDIEGVLIDGCRYTLEKNQLIFCTPLNVIDIPIDHNELISVVFNREFYCIRDNEEEVSCNGLLFYGSSSPTIIMLDENEKKEFKDIYAIIEDEFMEKDRSYAEMLRTMLTRLLIKSTRLVETRLNGQGWVSKKIETIREFNILVEMHFKTHHKLKDYAILLQKSPKTLSNIFSEHSDTTPLHVINERIFVESKRLILYSNKQICDIASILGYKDAGHFSKFFKKNAGISPLKFKKESFKNHKGNNLQFQRNNSHN